jgi:uracil DNA glycosylase
MAASSKHDAISPYLFSRINRVGNDLRNQSLRTQNVISLLQVGNKFNGWEIKIVARKRMKHMKIRASAGGGVLLLNGKRFKKASHMLIMWKNFGDNYLDFLGEKTSYTGTWKAGFTSFLED